MLKPLNYTTKIYKVYKIDDQNPFITYTTETSKLYKKSMLWLKPITYTKLKKYICVYFAKTIKLYKNTNPKPLRDTKI